MGVSGAGKSTVGLALADALGWRFEEGDDLHPAANVAKMASGVPLTDADRVPWLAAIGAWIDAQGALGEPGVVTCSALRRIYRDQLASGRPQVRFVYLRASRETVAARLAGRHRHFMPQSLLDSQFATLEPPAPEERAILVDADQPVGEQVTLIERLAPHSSHSPANLRR
jgi:gluconokinase